MKIYFTENHLQELFERDGYVIIDLLNEDQINSLKKIYKHTSSIFHRPKGLVSNVHNRSYNVNLRIDNEISRIVNPLMDKYLTGCKMLGSIFINKSNYKTNNKLDLHQDWSITNEFENEFELLVWAPLQDVTPENGCLVVLPGSHRVFKNAIRSFDFPSIYIDYNNEILKKHTHILSLKKGQAIVYTANLFHGSFPNMTQQPRLAIASTFIPENTALIYFVADKNNNCYYKYQIPSDFHLRYIHLLYKNKMDFQSFPKLATYQGMPEKISNQLFLSTICRELDYC